MRLFLGFILLILGVGTLVIVYQARSKGWLPFGPNFFAGVIKIRRQSNPLGFWLLSIVYVCVAMRTLVLAVSLMLGHADPLLPP